MTTTKFATQRILLLCVCLMGSFLSAQPLYENHWNVSTDASFTGSGGTTLTQIIDSSCSMVTLSVTDPVNSPLPSFSPMILNPQAAGGGDLTDLSGNMSFHVRVRSLDTVRLAMQLRSGGGGTAERTDRLEIIILGDTTAWTEHTFEFDATNLGGFDSTDLRDVWFFLDRGMDNFAGDEFIFDYFSIGAKPADSTLSTCPSGMMPPAMEPFYGLHWASSADPVLSGSGGSTLTQVLDSSCSTLSLSVTDPVNAPLGSFNPMIINPQKDGSDLVDLSGNMSFQIRALSRDSVTVGLLLRAGDGSSGFRTSRITQVVPGDTASWTELEFVFDASTIGGFDSTDLRDIWLYLDPGTDNFAGNDFRIDYFFIGGAPDSSTWSTCPEDSMPQPVSNVNYAIHYDQSSDPVFSGSAAGTLTQTIDTACSQLFLSVTDPVNAPWNGTSPIIINPLDTAGNDIIDLSGSMQFHLRVRSRDSVDLALRLRSGDGTSAFRTDRVSQLVPGDTLMWTELTYTFDATSIGGFDSMDLRDIWLHLDYGDDNFSGNAFWIDYFAVGEKPASSTHSGCSLLPPFDFPWIVHWADTSDQLTSGSSAVLLTQELDTTCSQLKISVTSPILEPHEAFKPIRLDPLDDNGFDLQDLSGQLKVYARVRSAAEVEFSIMLRSGGGTTSERTEIVTQTVPAGLDQWTDLVFDFSGSNLSGFDSTDLRDVFMYLDRSLPNWPGNEFYFDYVSIGSAPDVAANSTCVETVSISDTDFNAFTLIPNPVNAGGKLEIQLEEPVSRPVMVTLMSISGQIIQSDVQVPVSGSINLSLPRVSPGLYLIRMDTDSGSVTDKIIIQ